MISKGRFITMWLLAIVFIIGIGTCELARAGAVEDIKSMCAEKWGSNYRMQKHCFGRQIEAVNNFITTYNIPYANNIPKGTKWNDLSEETKIVFTCMRKWEDDKNRYNWRMVNYCCGRQFEAYNTMKNIN